MMKRLLSLTFCLMTTLLSFADIFLVDDIYYFYNSYYPDDEYVGVTNITDEYYGFTYEYTGDVNIPPSITVNGITYKVAYISDKAFRGCKNLTSVTLPNTITAFGDYQFSGCTSLTSFSIPNSVKEIGEYAFRGCSSLKSISIPNKVTSIGEGAFLNCSSLKSVSIPNSVTTINSRTFENCTGLTSVTIPSSVTTIGWRAFAGCTGLTSVTIPNSVTDIYMNAFQDCTSLTSVTIPESVTYISDYAFENCSSLKSVSIPNSVTEIGEQAFADCSSLTSVTIPESVTSIGNGAFWGCSGLTSVTIPGSVTSIGSKAFKDCSSLSTVHVWMENPVPISSEVFSNRANATLYVPKDRKSAYASANYWKEFKEIVEDNKFAVDGIFYKVTSSADQTVEVTYEGVSYDSYADEYAGTVKIPSSVTYDGKKYRVTKIGQWAFWGCKNLASVTIPNSVTEIGDFAFYDCTGLTSVIIPESVTMIGYHAFRGCTGLTSVTISNGVTRIGNCAFMDCTGITSITIPSSVRSIGVYAFDGCSRLASVYVNMENPITLYSNVFSNIKNATLYVPKGSKSAYEGANCWKEFKAIVEMNYFEVGGIYYKVNSTSDQTVEVTSGSSEYRGSVVVPSSITYGGKTYSVTKIGNEAFRACSGLTSITIPNSVKTIGSKAFRECSGLKSITLPNSVTSIDSYAFAGCKNLSHVTIPSSVTYIGNYAFYSCSSLISVTVGRETPISIGSNVFNNIENVSLYVPTGSKSAYSSANYWKEFQQIVEGFEAGGIYYSFNSFGQSVAVTYAGDYYNSYANEYTGTVEIPSSVIYNDKIYSVTIIGNNAFQSCSNLTSVTIPNSITSIGKFALRGCSGLTSVTIPNSVTTIGTNAFEGCTGLTSITIPEGVTKIGISAFLSCSNLTSVMLPSSVTTIGNFAFDGCSSLTSVYVSMETPVSISSNVFSNSANATLYVPKGRKSAYASADYWKEFKDIVEGFEVAGIYYKYSSSSDQTVEVTYKGNSSGSYAGEYVKTVNIPSSVTFGGKTYSVTKIGDEAFRGCKNLASVTIPESVTNIGSNAFRECSGLKSITLPNSVTSIDSYAFAGCNNLSTVTIPGSVKYIGNYAFYSCSSLTSVTVWRETPVSIGEYVFSNRANATLYVPKGSKSAYANANYWKEFKEIVELEIPYVVGDINGDNVVDILDYTGVGNYIHGNAPEGFNEQAADVDKNGIIDILDYTGIANIIHTGNIFGN